MGTRRHRERRRRQQAHRVTSLPLTRKCDSTKTADGHRCQNDVSVFRDKCEAGHTCVIPSVQALKLGTRPQQLESKRDVSAGSFEVEELVSRPSNQATEAVAQLSRYQRREVAADGKGFVTIDPEQLRWALGGLPERIDPEGRWDPDEARRVADGAALAVFAESVLENFFDSAAYGLGNLDLTDAVDEDFTFVLEALAEAGAEGSLHYDEGGAMGPLWFLLEAGELGFLPADLEHEDV